MIRRLPGFLRAQRLAPANACADSIEMFGITKDDLDPLVDGVWGVASFWMAAEDGPVTFI